MFSLCSIAWINAWVALLMLTAIQPDKENRIKTMKSPTIAMCRAMFLFSLRENWKRDPSSRPSLLRSRFLGCQAALPPKETLWGAMHDIPKNRYAMRTCVCCLKIIVGCVVVLHCTECWLRWFCMVSSLFRSFKNQWDYWEKKFKNLKDKVSGL